MFKLLIVEDDLALNQGILYSLQQEQYEMTQCYTLKAAEQAIKECSFDLIILDVNLPDGNGLDWCRKVRQTVDASIIFLTVNDLEIDVVTGFELGADDYITKPFSLMILRARVAAVLRRRNTKTNTQVFVIDDYQFDFEKMHFNKGASVIELSKTEQKLLRLLIMNRGQTIPRETLVDKTWTDGAEFVEENALSVAIKRLRQKLGDENRIQTVYGVGYTWKK